MGVQGGRIVDAGQVGACPGERLRALSGIAHDRGPEQELTDDPRRRARVALDLKPAGNGRRTDHRTIAPTRRSA